MHRDVKAKTPGRGGQPGARQDIALQTTAPILPQNFSRVKTLTHLFDLAQQASQKAERTAFAWRVAQIMGHPDEEVCALRRLMLSHQAVFWAARRVLAEKGER